MATHSPLMLAFADKLRDRVDFGLPHECWEFEAGRLRSGHGSLHLGPSKTTVLAHRMAFFLHNGWLPPVVCHLCHNPACCNPWHLAPGTHGLNHLQSRLGGRMGDTYSSKDECKRGHSLSDPQNVYAKRGRRECKTCRRLATIEHRRRRAS